MLCIGDLIALAIVNTILGGSTGGLVVLLINKLPFFSKHWSFLMSLNGALTGMVSLCAGCNLYEPWGALIVGAIGGFWFVIVHHLMLQLKLDDPLDAVAVHGAGGIVGIVAVPFFMVVNLEVGHRGLFWDGNVAYPWLVLGYNIAGALAIVLWTCCLSFLLFGVLYWQNILRVSADEEQSGMDIVKHGESAYPANAWVEDQYTREKLPYVMSDKAGYENTSFQHS